MASGNLVALTDSGAVIRFATPTAHRVWAEARIVDLPAGPGSPRRKSRRDAEALAADGDGWWIAFENQDSLWRFDPDFRSGREQIDLRGLGFPPNSGIEALAVADGTLSAWREESGERLTFDSERRRRAKVRGLDGSPSDAVHLSDGRILLLIRRFGWRGFSSGVYLQSGTTATRLVDLRLGPLDNPEAIAAAPLANGGTRLWIMTDNDMRTWLRTLLVAIDLPPAGRA